MSNFKDLNLSAKIISALEKKGYTHPTPIQLQAIPHLLEGKDLLGIAQTGTGKTAAFALPIIDNLVKSEKQVDHNNVRTLILTPTRELATQIVDNIKLYGADLGLRAGVVFGGVSISNQIKSAKQGFDILVATPGRLLDLMNQGHIKFSDLEIFVLDEADRMLDMGFINDVRKIITKLPKKRQTLFFSATMPKDVAVLADAILNNPVKVEVTPESTTVEKIDQRVNLVDKANKPLLLKSIVEQEGDKNLFLVFSRTKHGANRIVQFLEGHKIKVAAIHGNKSQGAREKALDGFRQGTLKVLVATDIAARGIDISGITHVINYDLPDHPESYVHRIGRTARAGREGIAISFCDNSELEMLRSIEKTIGMKLPIDESHPFHGVKPTASAKSALPERERPKSGYKTTPRPRQDGEREPSFFAKNRKWKSQGDGGRPLPKFDGDTRKPRSNFRSDAPRERTSERPSYNGEARTQKPRFESNDSRPRFESNDRPRFGSDDSRPARPRFGDDSRKPRFESSDSRPPRPRFGSDDSRPARPKFGDDRRSSSYDRSDRRSRFTSDDGQSREHKPRGDFGDRKPRFDGGDRPRSNDRPAFRDGGSDNRKSFGDRKPRFESSGSGFSGDRKPPRDGFKKDFNNDDKPRRSFSEGSQDARRKFDNGDRKERSFGGKSEGFKGRSEGFRGKPSGFGDKPRGFGGGKPGGFKPRRPTK